MHNGCSTVVLICFTCPAITVVTVILWALDRVRGRVLGWLGPGSPKSQPHQELFLPTGWKTHTHREENPQGKKNRGVAPFVLYSPIRGRTFAGTCLTYVQGARLGVAGVKGTQGGREEMRCHCIMFLGPALVWLVWLWGHDDPLHPVCRLLL